MTSQEPATAAAAADTAAAAAADHRTFPGRRRARTVSVLGLGPMGLPIARTLLASGMPLTVWNRTRSRAEELGAEGARVAETVADAAADGGPLALVRTGDMIVLDLANRRLDLEVAPGELASRTPDPATTAAFAAPERGWQKLYVDHVTSASTGADLDFLVGASGAEVLRESH